MIKFYSRYNFVFFHVVEAKVRKLGIKRIYYDFYIFETKTNRTRIYGHSYILDS